MMRALLARFIAASDGGAASTYMLFTACWFLAVAAGVHYATPNVTTKFEAVSAAFGPSGGPYR